MKKLERLLFKANNTLEKEYAATVNRKIRKRYSLSDELAILRRREENPSEFSAYSAFAEECKAAAKKEVYGEDGAV